jgi:hypothetical protein
MSEELSDRIYQAQCMGNIEPIEFMVPYPNIYSLIEGENIKYGHRVLFTDYNLTNKDFLRLVHQGANWLRENGLQAKERVFIHDLEYPMAEIIAFSIWAYGATVILASSTLAKKDLNGIKPSFVVNATNCPSIESLTNYSTEFMPTFRPALLHEALIYCVADKIIQLSHYNLLVNTNGLKKYLGLNRDDTFLVKLAPESTAWAVLQLILPLYAAASITSNNPKIIFGIEGQFDNPNYIIKMEWTKISKEKNNIFILPENTAILCIGNKPIHMTTIEKRNKNMKINGHSVMMGYMNENNNEAVFRNNGMMIKRT